MIYAPMALTKCPECGGKVSDKATQCPHCGCPIEKPHKQSKTCPECGQEVDASVMVCPNCAFPFSRIDEIGKPSNAANTIQNGKLIIEVDNPVIPLLASISIKIGGEKVAECHKGDIIELPIEKDCEVSFKWNMAFTSVSIYAAANEVKHLYIGFDSTNLQIYEEVLGQVGDVTVPNEESVAANIPEPMAEEFAGQQAYYPVQSNGSSKWGYIITIAIVILPNYFWVKETDFYKDLIGSGSTRIESQATNRFTTNEDVLRAIKFKSFDTDFGSVDTDDNWFVYSGGQRVGSIAVEEKSGNSAIIGIHLDAGVGTIVVRYKIYTDGTCTKLSER